MAVAAGEVVKEIICQFCKVPIDLGDKEENRCWSLHTWCEGKALHQRESKSPDTNFTIVESQMGWGPVGNRNG